MTNISFILVNSSMDSATSILLYIFPMSVMIQFFAAICISYYRRKYQKHDTKVYHIQLRLANDGNADESGRNCETNDSFEVNTPHQLFRQPCVTKTERYGYIWNYGGCVEPSHRTTIGCEKG